MTVITYVDAEDVVCAWVKSLTLPTNPKVLLAPKEVPLPGITMARTGGSPSTPLDEPRISFDVWAANRPQCKAITAALVSEIDSLQFASVITIGGGKLHGGEVLSWFWLPDNQPDPPISRYVLDAVFMVTAL